jgi:hypothetical protein
VYSNRVSQLEDDFSSPFPLPQNDMSDLKTILATLDFTRERLLGSLDSIAKSGQDARKVVAWRPGPGRAHIAWQAMHCAATHDRYIHVRILGGSAADPALCDGFAGGSTPSDTDVPSLDTIYDKLSTHFSAFKQFLQTADLTKVTEFPNNIKRTTAESAILLAWHEAHHQGQIHLTWNLYKAAHGIA